MKRHKSKAKSKRRAKLAEQELKPAPEVAVVTGTQTTVLSAATGVEIEDSQTSEAYVEPQAEIENFSSFPTQVELEKPAPAEVPARAKTQPEDSEISVELQEEMENFTNSFHVQRHPGTPPARPASELAAQRSASASHASAPLPSAADRRANPRYAFNATAEVVAIDSRGKVKARVRDLSQQGCYLDAESPLPLGTTANIRMIKGAKSLEVQGRVVYVQPGKGMGIMFTAVKPEHGGILDAWINESRETSWLANNRRRSQRVLMKVPVRVSVQVGTTPLVEEETYTLAVSAHGALIAVSAPMYRGQRLTLSNPLTKDSLECVVAHIDRFPNEQVKVGVEFLLPNPTFWHVAFPPKDWSPRHPDAKRQPH
ncbi:MAG TPA: PilZ domain-containing protein [Candidatus Dormibacteraeota bacterium]|nr:PilZ domain-containing protein [Candidatus Dormibacteraeota bacterium]